MARPSDITTKSIATRIPMEEYIRILKEASSKGQSISEWLQICIFKGDDKSAHEALNKKLSEAQKKIKDLASKVKKKPTTVTKEVKDPKLVSEIRELKATNKKATAHNIELQKKIQQMEKAYNKWAKDMEKNTASSTTKLEKTIEGLEDITNNLKSENKELKSRIKKANDIIKKEGFRIGSGILKEGESWTV